MHFNVTLFKRLIVTCLMVCVWPHFALAQNTAHILIITNSNDKPYQEAVGGFKVQIDGAGAIKFTELTLAEAKSSTGNDVSALKPTLIYALGVEATDWARQQTTSTPIVATMVLKDDVFKKSANITGVSLGYSLKTQFQWLKKYFQPPKTVAILFNAAENAQTVDAAKSISQQEGFKLVAIPVETPKELPYALEQLANNIDILMAIPDETAMSINTAKEVLLASFSNKVPLIGLSDNWVKSGALYALTWDYDDLGRQSATLAQKLMKGASISSISPEHPRKVAYTINAKIAEHMDLEIPDDLLKNAKMVFN